MKKALVLAMVCAFGLGAAAFGQGVLSGSWTADMCIAPQTPIFTSFDSTLTVEYSIAGWTFTSETVFDMAGWQGQTFNVDGILGAFTIASEVLFHPQSAAFGYWHNAATVNIAGVALNFETILLDLLVDCSGAVMTPGFGMLIGVEGGAADLTFAADLYINSYLEDIVAPCTTGGHTFLAPVDDYCLCFTSVSLNITFPFCCIELVDVTVGFSQGGFDGITFELVDIVLPNLPWVSFTVDLTFDDQTYGKTLELTPEFVVGDMACVTVYAEFCYIDPVAQQTAGLCDITGINIYGIGLECEFNGCTFTSISSLDAGWNEDLIGYADYWEKFCIACGGDSCCGGAFSFDVCTYFDANSALLFDWGMTVINLSFGISSNFDLTTGLTVSELGFTEWCIGFEVTW